MRTTPRSAPGTAISWAHSSGTSVQPNSRAAMAGKEAVISGVVVKMALTTSSDGDIVEADDGVEQVSRRLEDVLGGIGLDRRRAAYPATGDVPVTGRCWLSHGISLRVRPIGFHCGSVS